MIHRRLHLTVLVVHVAALTVLAAAGLYSSRKAGLRPADLAFFPLRVDSTEVRTADDAELLLSRYAVGDSVTLAYRDLAGQGVVRRSVTVPYEGGTFIAFKLLLAGAILALGAVVVTFRPPATDSALFALATAALAVSIAGTKTIYAQPPLLLGTFLCAAFFAAYAALPALFVHFSLYFPTVSATRLRRWVPVIHVAALLLAGWNIPAYLHDARAHVVAQFDSARLPMALLNGFVTVGIALGVGSVVRSYIRAHDGAERKKLRWVLFGLSVGPAPFVLGQALPQAFGASSFIPEPMMLASLFVIPVTFAIAIVRHRLLNIDLIINRSIVYGVSFGLLVAVATLLFGVLATMVDAYTRMTSPLVFIAVAVSFAMLFQPLKARVQEFVDRRLFHLHYDYRQLQKRLAEEIRRAYEPRGLARLVIGELRRVMPVDRVGFFSCSRASHRLRLLAHEGFDLLEDRGVPLRVEELRSLLRRPVALTDSVEPGVDMEPADTAVFDRWGMALVVACLAEDGGILGFLVLGRKRSGYRFLAEDVELLAAIAAQCGLALERIAVQERLLLEHEEAERLSRLSQMKSYFVSSVSHDLKTPLTSIRMFAELLRSDTLPAKDREEFLGIIEGESDRLTRMINTVLDFSMIEKGVKSYRPVPTDLNAEVDGILRSVAYRLRMERFALERRLAPGPLLARVDRDAFAEAVWNLLSNAMKYSPGERWIGVTTLTRDGEAGVRVEDRGSGVAEEHRARIFEQFYRVEDARHGVVTGSGLGLAIVKHIMEGHGGSVELESAVGKGSSFTLWFPKGGTDETHPAR